MAYSRKLAVIGPMHFGLLAVVTLLTNILTWTSERLRRQLKLENLGLDRQVRKGFPTSTKNSIISNGHIV